MLQRYSQRQGVGQHPDLFSVLKKPWKATPPPLLLLPLRRPRFTWHAAAARM
jgi:hypothetical protein